MKDLLDIFDENTRLEEGLRILFEPDKDHNFDLEEYLNEHERDRFDLHNAGKPYQFDGE